MTLFDTIWHVWHGHGWHYLTRFDTDWHDLTRLTRTWVTLFDTFWHGLTRFDTFDTDMGDTIWHVLNDLTRLTRTWATRFDTDWHDLTRLTWKWVTLFDTFLTRSLIRFDTFDTDMGDTLWHDLTRLTRTLFDTVWHVWHGHSLTRFDTFDTDIGDTFWHDLTRLTRTSVTRFDTNWHDFDTFDTDMDDTLWHVLTRSLWHVWHGHGWHSLTRFDTLSKNSGFPRNVSNRVKTCQRHHMGHENVSKRVRPVPQFWQKLTRFDTTLTPPKRVKSCQNVSTASYGTWKRVKTCQAYTPNLVVWVIESWIVLCQFVVFGRSKCPAGDIFPIKWHTSKPPRLHG